MRTVSVLSISTLLALGTGCTNHSISAELRCEHSAPRTLQLDYTGVRSVAFVSTGLSQLRITGTPTADGNLTARACASSAELLKQLALRQERQGEHLTVTLEHAKTSWSWFDRQYAWLLLEANVPAEVALEVNVAAGDIKVMEVAALSGAVGAGNLDVYAVAGEVALRQIGAGNVEIDDVGSLSINDIGAGNVEINHVRGAVSIGNIGAGNVELDGAGGDVSIGSVGTGNVEIAQVGGSVSVDSIGIGSLEVKDVSGNLSVKSKGIGSIHHQRVGGTVEIP